MGSFFETILTLLILFIIFFPVISFVYDQRRDLGKLKVRFQIITNPNNGNVTLGLKYRIWEFRKKQYLLEYVENHPIIEIEGNMHFERTSYYKGMRTINNQTPKSFTKRYIVIYTR